MSTRGLYGLRKNGADKTTYNHFDSYPECLGRKMINLCAEYSRADLSDIYVGIILVGDNPPTKEQIAECKKRGFCDFSVSTGKETDWYCLLRNTQGNILLLGKEALNGGFFMIDNHSFIKDSLFCEYAYIINLDEGMLEYYEGFQKEPQEGNRYGETADERGYCPCRLVKRLPLKAIREDSARCFKELMNEEEL